MGAEGAVAFLPPIQVSDQAKEASVWRPLASKSLTVGADGSTQMPKHVVYCHHDVPAQSDIYGLGGNSDSVLLFHKRFHPEKENVRSLFLVLSVGVLFV